MNGLLPLVLFALQALAQDSAVQLDGDGDYVDLGAVAPGSAFTVEGWIQWDALHLSGCCDALIEAVDASGYNTFGVIYNGSSWQIEINDTTTGEGDSCGDGVALCVTDTPAMGTPIHVAGVVDGGDVSLYLDGALAGSTSFSAGPSFSGHTWILGADSDGTPYTSDNITGALDEWRIWDHARTESELQCLRDWSLTGGEAGLLAHWGMNDGSGSTAVDGTGGGLDGTLMGDTSWITSPMGLSPSVGGDIGCLDGDGDGETPDDGDCDDTDGSVWTGATEVCDGVDNDCDSVIDPDTSADAGTWYDDSDGDGLGDTASPLSGCSQPSGTVENDDDDCPTQDASACDLDGDGCLDDVDADGISDCDDVEECDGGDNDGDGLVDDDDPDVTGQSTWYADADSDTYGDPATTVVACDAPPSAVADDTDCDDTDGSVNPGAAELWYDGVDQDCDGNDDDQDGDAHAWDGVAGGDDCDDTDATVYPGASDTWYDGVDSDCLGNDDDDADGDGHASASHGGDDCDDSDPDTYPGAPDTPYDGLINDCDDADEYDQDGDGWHVDDDCDDNNSAVNPDATEIWYDGTDQDCDDNDDDQDGDGYSYETDCDDTDPNAWPGSAGWTEDCDPVRSDTADTGWGETGLGDTGGTGGKDDDCGCSTRSGDSGAWLLFVVVGLAGRRRWPHRQLARHQRP